MISPEKWERVKEIFSAALKLRPPSVSAYLSDACRGDAGIRAEVERLLHQNRRVGDFMEETASGDSNVACSVRLCGFVPEEIVGGRFRIIRFINRGGMGEVYEAEDQELLVRVALKTLLPAIAADGRMIERFKREIQLSRKVSHPNVCRVFDLVRHAGTGSSLRSMISLTMEFLPGETLSANLARQGRMAPDAAVPLIGQMSDALDAAHQAGVIHRDFKPSNVILVAQNGGLRSVVTDFGLARSCFPLTEITATVFGEVVGTRDYMAPELFGGHIATPASDVFAFGVVLHEMLTGQKPRYNPDKTRYLMPSNLVKDLPSVWDRVILKCLDPHPHLRFQCAGDATLAILTQSPSTRSIVARTQTVRHMTIDRSRSLVREESYADHAPSPVTMSRRAAGYLATGLLAGGAAILGYRLWFSTQEAIAVLPFENKSKDDSLDYLSDGITESLINSLSQLPRLRVPAAGLVRRFKGTAVPTKAGATLNTNAVLTGVLRRREGLLTVDVELIDVATGKQIWGKQYTLTWTNVLDVQESICAGILSSLQIRMSPQEIKILRRGLTANDEAFQLYLRGQYLLELRTVEALTKSRDLFAQAVERDSEFALAYSGLASSRLLLGYYGAEAPGTSMPAARTAALKAVAIEPTLAEAHNVLGAVQAIFEWNWSGAEASFRKAIALKDDLAEAHHWYSRMVLSPLARFSEAIAEMKNALKWDPYAPILHTNLGVILYYARRFDDAIAQLQRVIEMDPRFSIPYWTLGQAWAAKGHLAKAVDALEIAGRLQPGPKPDLSLAYCYAICGKRTEGRALRDEVVRKYHRPSFTYYELAYVDSALGNKENALRELLDSWTEKEPQLVHLGADPKFDPLRSTHDYSEMLRKIGLNPTVYNTQENRVILGRTSHYADA